MNIQSKINLVDNLIFQSANFRIVVCSNNHQWIIQKRFGKSISEQGWQSISYHRSKDSLVRVYNEKLETRWELVFSIKCYPHILGVTANE